MSETDGTSSLQKRTTARKFVDYSYGGHVECSEHRVNSYIENKATQIVFGWKFHEFRILRTYQCCQVSPRFLGQLETTNLLNA